MPLLNLGEHTLKKFERYCIDLIAAQIFEVLTYCMRIIKFHNVESNQRVTIFFRNAGGKEVVFDEAFLTRPYSFTNQNEISFSFEFDPKKSWKGMGLVLLKIFRELCTEIGCIAIDDSSVTKRVFKIISDIDELRTEYNGPVVLPRININDFCLS